MNFSDLNALYINTSLKKNAGESHTRLLLNASASIMQQHDVSVEHVHFAGTATNGRKSGRRSNGRTS